MYTFWLTAITVIMTWVFNNTMGSSLMAILIHASMDAFPNDILWPTFPDAATITQFDFLYGYLGLAIGFGSVAVLLIVLTKGRLSYQNLHKNVAASLLPWLPMLERRATPGYGSSSRN